MIGWTLCSGIGAPEVAAPWVDWRLAAEVEPFPREVLQQRHGYKVPENHNQGDPLLWGDMTEVTPELARSRGVPLPDLLVAGTPCQAFSIAGLRKGTDDERGNLTLKFVETCHAIVDARPDGKLAVLWENVPGVLSDKGNAFGCFLGGLVGAVDALQPPADGSWPSEGMVQGPRARLAWCVLDAQWFGVAQRRRRVFVVVDFGGACDPAQVLLEPDSLRGDFAPRREKGKGPAGAIADGVNLGSGGRVVAPRQTAIGEYCVDDTASCLAARDFKSATDLVYPETFSIMPMNSGKDYKARRVDVCQPLMAGGPVGGNQGGDFVVCDPPIAWSEELTASVDVAGAIQRGGSGGGVRRFIPVECERLQGFPDGFTNVTYRKKAAPDGVRYKALGNSMAVPCIKWILDRIGGGK